MRVKLAGELAKLVEDDLIIMLKDGQIIHQLNHQWLEATLLPQEMHCPANNATIDDNPTKMAPRIMYIQ